jgi:hypothetical protein
MEWETIDQIMDNQIKGTRQQRIQIYRVVKSGKLLHQGKWITWGQVHHKFPHLMGVIKQWIPLIPKGGGMIQVDIGGDPPIPLAQRIVFHFGSFLFTILGS